MEEDRMNAFVSMNGKAMLFLEPQEWAIGMKTPPMSIQFHPLNI